MQVVHMEESIARHRQHIVRLEQILRLLDNDAMAGALSFECILLCSSFGGFSSDRFGVLLLLAAGRLPKVSVDPNV